MNVLESTALRVVAERLDVTIERGRFRKTLLERIRAHCTGEDDVKIIAEASKGLVPDGYWIDEEDMVLHLIEVEDTNPLKDAKILRINELMWVLDSLSWNLRVHVTDRYGMSIRTLDFAFFSTFEDEYWRDVEAEQAKRDRRPA